ncbi:TetR/AcrR family transcriptional regulator [Clostridium sp. 'White wine YQ']|uniref:TetR/AcrR family transcriptional regulator n=1 Tax=Clostridium sp. 'White wine YQ' TaxID=3027474 RepID=UPI00236714B0|nr:TetR/AcrR family transcriptional regulator [Clostridium sp. 'White wine YQ']MDD7795693.1 TetR/AcrR family transcriptional regulator [Clostridium sp. 'White wine YQ']
MAKNTKGEQSKNKLIECAAELFMKNGYNATGINDILALAELPKGSFYFHFSSKKNLAIEVSYYFDRKINEWIIATSKGKKWDEFITELIQQMISGAEQNKHYGCPFAVLGLEIAFSEPDISEYYNKSIKKLISAFKDIFEFSGIESDASEEIAHKVFAIYEGYLVYYRISKDVDVLKRMLKDLINVYINYKEVKV